MLTPIKLLPVWNAFALRHGLPTTEEPDAATALPGLSSAGEVNGHHVAFRYAKSVETVVEPDVDPRDLIIAAAGIATVPSGTRELGKVSYVLSAATTTASPRDGSVRVERDPSPTLRRVAAWVGAGDPEVGDEAFDRRFLITAESEALARDVLRAPLRRALAAADVEGASFTCAGQRAEWSRAAAVDADADATLEAALAVVLAVHDPG